MTAPARNYWELLIPISEHPSERLLRSFMAPTPFTLPTQERLIDPALNNEALPRFVPLGSVLKVHSWPKL